MRKKMDKGYLSDRLDAGWSLKQIARETGRTPGTVGYWVKRYGLVANGAEKFSPNRPLDREQLQPLLASGMSVVKIADVLQTTPRRVKLWTTKLGLDKETDRTARANAIQMARQNGESTLTLECRKHGLTEFWIGATRTRCKRCNAGGVTRRRRKVKEILVAESGGCCSICGYDRSLAALQFHHLDPAAKSFGLAEAGITRSIDAARKEVEKCVLLCSNCHAEVEAGDLEVSGSKLTPAPLDSATDPG